MNMSLGELRELAMDREAWRAAIHAVAKSDTTGRLNWTEPPLVFLPGKVHKQRSLADYRPKGSQELDTTEQLTHTHI